MGRMATAERVCAEASDNFVFQRSLLAYHAAAERIDGDVLEIGTGSGYGVEVIAPHARSFVTLDKHVPGEGSLPSLPHVRAHHFGKPLLPYPHPQYIVGDANHLGPDTTKRVEH